MTPDQLRALADALYFQGRYGYETETQAATRRVDERRCAAAYLRAQADAQPVSVVPVTQERGPWSADRQGRHIWIESDDFTHDVRLDVSGDFGSRDQKFAYAQEIARRLNAAPAAPQAEEPMWKRLRDAGFTKRDNRITCDECGKRFTPQFLPIHKCEPIDPHMIVSDDRFPDEQAEPKREPLSDERIAEEATNRQMTAACEDAFYDGVRWAEHSHEIGGSDAE